jgi:hypothetical protein
MCQEEEAEKLSNSSEHCQVRNVSSLLAQALSLRFNHEGFCDELYVYRKTPPLVLFADFQAAFLIAG